MLKNARYLLPLLLDNKNFRQSHKNWGKYCEPEEVGGDEKKKLANEWFDRFGWTPAYIERVTC